MARSRYDFKRHLPEFIKCFTGFEEDEENYDLCHQFCVSNFKYHRFLDVDSHKVGRAIKGLEDKFEIHSQQDKAKAFRDLVEDFLETRDYENRDHGKTDTHYAILQLLINLADNPTQSKYKKPRKIARQEEQDEFDWKAYLLEGEDLYNEPFPDSPEWSDEEDEDEAAPKSSAAGAVARILEAEEAASRLVVEECESDSVLEPSWLEQNLIPQYWEGEEDVSYMEGSDHSSDISNNWTNYKRSTGALLSTSQAVHITEEWVIREILWMLSGSTDTFIYKYTDGQFVPSEEFCISHLTQESVKHFLSELGRYGRLFHELSTFTRDCPVSDSTSQTVQAYASCVDKFLQDYLSKNAEIEKKIISQECSSTFLGVMEDLQPSLDQLEVLHQIYTDSIQDEHCNDNTTTASRLLAVLHQVLEQKLLQGAGAKHLVPLLYSVWVKTWRPYIDIIHGWLTTGSLYDPREEFIIHRNKGLESTDEQFWTTVYDIAESYKTDCQRDTTGSLSLRTSQSSQTCLTPILGDLMQGGKSMAMLEKLGQLQYIIQAKKSEQEPHLYETFISSLQQYIAQIDGVQADDLSLGSRALSLRSSAPLTQQVAQLPVQLANQLKLKGCWDPLLNQNFSLIFHPESTTVQPSYQYEIALAREIQNMSQNVGDFISPQVLLENCLYPHVRQRYTRVCKQLLQILMEEHKLMEYIQIMKSLYVLEADDVMSDFYLQIFDKLQHFEPWQDANFLNSVLDEALHQRHQQHIPRTYVYIEEITEIQPKTPIHAIDNLRLCYKIPWPISIVITSECLSIYQQVLCFLLQVQRAKYSLDSLRFADLEKSELPSFENIDLLTKKAAIPELSKQQKIHRLQIFRMKVLHFVNSFHNTIMTRILHTCGLELEKSLQKVTDLDQCIAVHNVYLKKIYERCLLHKKVQKIKAAVTKVLDLAITLQRKWDEGLASIRTETIENMESDFQRCIQFLLACLSNTVKRGSFPHLESLAFTLETSYEYSKP